MCKTMMQKTKSTVTLFLAFFTLATAVAQQGGGGGQVPEDTLIRSRGQEKTGFKPVINHNTFYRWHVGLSYSVVSGDSAEKAYDSKHTVGLNYSITENSLHPYYRAFFPQAFAGWNVSLTAGYDGVRRMNYFGSGNETKRNPTDQRFNWLRTENLYGSLGLNKSFQDHHLLGFDLYYDGVRVREDKYRLSAEKTGVIAPEQYNRQDFLGSRIIYAYSKLDRRIIPTKGVEFSTSAAYTENLQRGGHSFARFTGDLDVYVPLFNDFFASVSTGLATVTGNPDFFQLNTIGGTHTLRGFERFRFYGKTAFYNQNELLWLPTVDTKFYQGEFGIFSFVDQGRVWHPGESSDKMHVGYGGGIILSPLNKITVKVAYGISNDDKRFHLNLKRLF